MILRNKYNGYIESQRIYRKGGGGGSAPDYEGERYRQRAAQRDAFYKGIGYTTGAEERNKQYEQMANDIRNYRLNELDKEYQRAMKQLNFNMARAGQSGGSQEIYERGRLKEEYDRARAAIEQDIEKALASSKMGYENAVSSGVSAINSGADAATQIAGALQKFSAAMQDALQGAKGVSYGGFFNSIGSAVENNAIRRGAMAGAAGIPSVDDKTVAPISGKSSGFKGVNIPW